VRDEYVYLNHIFECIQLIEKYVSNISKDQFYQSVLIQDAVIRRFEIIGEAVKNVSKLFKEQNPNIPWKEMAGMRDVLIHEYFGVDLEDVWSTCVNDLPPLKEQVLKLLIEKEIS